MAVVVIVVLVLVVVLMVVVVDAGVLEVVAIVAVSVMVVLAVAVVVRVVVVVVAAVVVIVVVIAILLVVVVTVMAAQPEQSRPTGEEEGTQKTSPLNGMHRPTHWPSTQVELKNELCLHAGSLHCEQSATVGEGAGTGDGKGVGLPLPEGQDAPGRFRWVARKPIISSTLLSEPEIMFGQWPVPGIVINSLTVPRPSK
mmetsp:Transcript_32905/g.59705  ORF Transcript_32905/g.59705 Transcript_32905/m.59705 type:complete len:198 (+) Transcript_32905:761-1354(+)